MNFGERVRMLWLYLLGLATVLYIALRRSRKRQKPLDDELYSKTVAIDHVQSGVAWVRADGTFGSVNQSFARTFNLAPRDLAGREWFKMFPTEAHDQIRAAYSQMLLMGAIVFDAPGERADGSPLWLNVRLVPVHDHNMRFVGHHCLVDDRTEVHELEERLRTVSATAERREARRPESPVAQPAAAHR
jgi:PAS domain S-box-containing protein